MLNQKPKRNERKGTIKVKTFNNFQRYMGIMEQLYKNPNIRVWYAGPTDCLKPLIDNASEYILSGKRYNTESRRTIKKLDYNNLNKFTIIYLQLC